ncbi:MAG: type II toxin-antitoxin system RelE/ParE family toxin [Chromatiales bacterium]|nr:type II toxin-antitoxin system RelE/ParE family toxin [Chromatiales bacterium]
MVKWTKHAKSQLRLIHDYIAQDSPLYAKRVAGELVRKTIGLDEIPRMGKVVPELRNPLIRELDLYSYRILYEIKSERLVFVLAVIHKRRKLDSREIPTES